MSDQYPPGPPPLPPAGAPPPPPGSAPPPPPLPPDATAPYAAAGPPDGGMPSWAMGLLIAGIVLPVIVVLGLLGGRLLSDDDDGSLAAVDPDAAGQTTTTDGSEPTTTTSEASSSTTEEPRPPSTSTEASTPPLTRPPVTDPPDPPDGVFVDLFSMLVGDCWEDPDDWDDLEEVLVVDCEAPHDNEVFAIFDLPDGPYPGDEAVESDAADGCLGLFEGYVGRKYSVSVLEIFPFWPSPGSWESGDREVVCNLYHQDLDRLRGSMEGADV